MKINILYILIVLFSYLISALAQDKFIVIINSENNVETLSTKQVSDMLLKKVVKWEDGSKIKPVDQNSDSKVRENFSKAVHNKSVRAIIAYWQRKIFSGRGVPPVEKNSSKEVISFVKENSNAIGYLAPGSSIPDGVKKVKVKN